MAIDNIARGMAASSSGSGGGGINADIVKGVGIDFEGTDPITIKNSGVTSVSESSTNGTINVSNGGKTPVQVPVHGLGTAAYKNVDTIVPSTRKVNEKVLSSDIVLNFFNFSFTLTLYAFPLFCSIPFNNCIK